MSPDVLRVIISYLRLSQLRGFLFEHNVDPSFNFCYDASNYTVRSEVLNEIFGSLEHRGCTVIGVNTNKIDDIVTKFVGLKIMKLYDCKISTTCANVWPNIHTIMLNRCDGVHNVDYFKGCLLRGLDVRRSGLFDVTGLNCFLNLRYVCFRFCTIIGTFDLGCCEHLKDIEFSSCGGIKNNDGFALCNLTKLIIHNCSDFVGIHGLTKWSNLRHLRLSECDKLMTIDGLLGCDKLEIVNLNRCCSLRKLDGLCSPNLKILILWRCLRLNDIEGIVRCHKLEALVLSSLRSLTKIPSVEWYELKFLVLSDLCIIDVLNIKLCHKLECVNVSWCEKLEDLSDLIGLQELKGINLWGCESLKSLIPLSKCSKLSIICAFASDCAYCIGWDLIRDKNVSFCTWNTFCEKYYDGPIRVCGYRM